MPDYNVVEGDCIWSIAKAAGFLPETIWNHPNNSSLKAQRKDPNILLPDDVVFVPDLTIAEFDRPTDQLHKFQLNGGAQLRIRLLDDGDPRANEKYTLNVDDKRTSGQTDADGWITAMISADAKEGRLSLKNGDEQHTIQLGYLDPIDAVSGVQARLRNLGLYGGEISGEMDDETSASVLSFQNQNQLEETGTVDEPTQSALKSAYGS
jgi:Putative peptidoglycan binding domain